MHLFICGYCQKHESAQRQSGRLIFLYIVIISQKANIVTRFSKVIEAIYTKINSFSAILESFRYPAALSSSRTGNAAVYCEIFTSSAIFSRHLICRVTVIPVGLVLTLSFLFIISAFEKSAFSRFSSIRIASCFIS